MGGLFFAAVCRHIALRGVSILGVGRHALMPPIAVNFLRLMNFNPSVFGANAESTSPKVEAICAPLLFGRKLNGGVWAHRPTRCFDSRHRAACLRPLITVSFLRLMNFNRSVFGANAESTPLKRRRYVHRFYSGETLTAVCGHIALRSVSILGVGRHEVMPPILRISCALTVRLALIRRVAPPSPPGRRLQLASPRGETVTK